MEETQRAKTAYAEYLAMGPGRSLEGLAADYKRRLQTDRKLTVPTGRLRTLVEWSRLHNWQARIAAEEERRNEALVERSTDALDKAREDLLKLTQAGVAIVAKNMRDKTFKADDVPALERLAKLQMQLLGAPLAEKTEVAHSGEVAVSWWERVRHDQDCGEPPADNPPASRDPEAAEEPAG